MALHILPRHASRYRQIASLLLRHGRGDLVKAAGMDAVLDEETATGNPAAAAELADDLEKMGPTFIKLGQLLSSRVDLLSPAYVEALARLQDDVEPFPFEEAEEIVSRELGVRLSRVFPTFEHKPMAAASLGQVHRATLRDGREVVVKVQRPGIRGQILEDMEVLSDLADFIDGHTELGERYGFGDLLMEFRASLLDELDYRREADNLATIGKILEGNERLLVPTPYPDLTTSRVLTMDYVEGRKITDLGPLGRLELDGAPLADALVEGYLRQVLVEGVFHADPHPGNVLLTPDHRIALLDVGMVARVAPAVRDKLVKLLLALADARPEEVSRVARTLGEELDDFDAALFERAIADVVGRSADASMADLDIGATLLELTRKAGEAGLRMHPELVMLGKTMLNLDQVAATLDPQFEPRAALRRHTAELMRGSIRTTPAAMMASLLEAKEFVEALPARVNRAFDALGEGHFELRVKAFDEDEFLRGMHKLANVVAAGLILSAMILSSALLARTSDGQSTVGSRIALVVFVVSILTALAMLARIGWQSKHVRTNRRR
jgi:predicted unusual protein kinase regulating ubiquinone biosynthesis (AarF/ABC1/UbiB family)